MAKRQSKYSQQFNKEWRRVTAAIRRTKKQGYQVGFNLGPKPTKITKRMLTRLQKITPKVIREQSFYISSTGWLISGDSLFEGSIGRTDLEGGSYATLIKSITEHLMILPEETVVYPGHGAYTTIGEEKKCNPFL